MAKVKPILFFAGTLLMALGCLSCAIGIAFSLPENMDALDPILAVTKDAWIIFLESRSMGLIVYGIGGMLIGAALTWFGELIPKKNRRLPRWEKRIC